MIIRAPRPPSKYTLIDNKVINDARLSFKARGILIYILSKPDNWVVHTLEIAKAGGEKCGRESVLSALRELETVGYLVRTRTRNDKGQWVHIQEIRDTPVDPSSDKQIAI